MRPFSIVLATLCKTFGTSDQLRATVSPASCARIKCVPVAVNVTGSVAAPLELPASMGVDFKDRPAGAFGAHALLFIGCYRLGERLCFTVSGYVPDGATTRAELAPLVRDALADMGLCGTVS